MASQKIIKEGYLLKVRSGGWGTNKRWFVLSREVGTSTHTLMYFHNEAARKTHFSQPGGVYSVKLIKGVKARDRDDPKNVGISVYFKTNTPMPVSPKPEGTNKEEQKPAEKDGEKSADKAESQAASPKEESAAGTPQEEGASAKEEKQAASPQKGEHRDTKEQANNEKAEPAKESSAAAGEKTFLLLEADSKAEADAWIAALAKAHGDEGNISQQVLLQEETDRLREERAAREKHAEELPKIEGELRKLKQTNKLGIGAWQSRFFSLDAEFFSYYKSNKKGEPLGFFPVNQMVCVGTSDLQNNTCFFFRLPATFSAGDGKYLKSGAPVSPTSPAASEGETEDEKKTEAKPDSKPDAKADSKKDPIILLRCATTADRDKWIQAFADLGVKKAHSKDSPPTQTKPESKPDEKANETAKDEKSAKPATDSAASSASSHDSSAKANQKDGKPTVDTTAASDDPDSRASSPVSAVSPRVLPSEDD